MCWSMSGSHGLWEPVTHPSYQPGWVEVVPRVGGGGSQGGCGGQLFCI